MKRLTDILDIYIIRIVLSWEIELLSYVMLGMVVVLVNWILTIEHYIYIVLI
ncbi:protein of unknown function [Methanocaldococcus lauensis]|nr:protein of unknown function [Methanocaldococcus lauensis]